MKEWNLKLNHTHPKTIALMSKKHPLPEIPTGLKDNSPTNTCRGFINGNTASCPHKRTSHDAASGSSLSSDICGPIEPTFKHNSNYFLTLIETRTRYLRVHCLTYQAKVPHTIVEAIDHVAAENDQTHLLILYNAQEYLAKQVQAQPPKRGTTYCTTTLLHPQENALPERINRTLTEKVRATLSHSHYQDALNEAVFKYNLTYYHIIQDTLHRQWYGDVPCLKTYNRSGNSVSRQYPNRTF